MHECLRQFAAVFRHLPCWCCRRELLAWAEPTSSYTGGQKPLSCLTGGGGGFKFCPIHEEQILPISREAEKVSTKQGCRKSEGLQQFVAPQEPCILEKTK